jgi:hypothetical protein
MIWDAWDALRQHTQGNQGGYPKSGRLWSFFWRDTRFGSRFLSDLFIAPKPANKPGQLQGGVGGAKGTLVRAPLERNYP